MSEFVKLRVGDHVGFLSGFPFASDLFHNEDGVRLIRIRDLLGAEGNKIYFKGHFDPRWLIRNSDILIGMDGDFHIVRWKSGPALLNQRILKVEARPNSGITQDYFYHWSGPRLLEIHSRTAATTVKHLSVRDLDKAVGDFPPVPTQRRIASILMTLDEEIEATESLIGKYQQIKAGLMHDLFTRGLWTQAELARGDHKGTPAESTAKPSHLRPTPEQAPQLYQDSPLGKIPRAWEFDRVGNLLARIEQGWSPDCESVPPEGDEWGILKTSAVVWGGFEPRESKRLPGHMIPRPQYRVSKGDVLMTRAGPNSRVGVVALVDTSDGNLMLSDKLYRCVPNERVESEFLARALSSEGTQHVLDGYKTGLAESQTNISQAIVKKLWISLPQSQERQSICDLAAISNQRLRTTSTHLAKLRQQKQGLMHDLLTGRVRVDC